MSSFRKGSDIGKQSVYILTGASLRLVPRNEASGSVTRQQFWIRIFLKSIKQAK